MVFSIGYGMNSVMQVDFIRGDVRRCARGGVLSFGSLSEPNGRDQPVNLSPVLLDDGPTGELISLGALGSWEMSMEPNSYANKIWESWW